MTVEPALSGDLLADPAAVAAMQQTALGLARVTLDARQAGWFDLLASGALGSGSTSHSVAARAHALAVVESAYDSSVDSPAALYDAEGVLLGIAVLGEGVDALRRPQFGGDLDLWGAPGRRPARGGVLLVIGTPDADALAKARRAGVVLVPAGAAYGAQRRHAHAWQDALRDSVARLVFLPVDATELIETQSWAAAIEAYGGVPRDAVVTSTGGTSAIAQPRGSVVFFTGLSGAGKSTLAKALADRLAASGRAVTLLDGDVVRRNLSYGLGFSREDRDANVLRIAFVASEVARHGGVAICAPIAPYDDTRRRARALVEAVGEFVLVHVATSIEECERRDRKGLYAQARRGELVGFTGVDDPYEPPTDAEVVIDTGVLSIPEAVARLLEALATSASLAG